MVKSYIGISTNKGNGNRKGTYWRYPYGFPIIGPRNRNRWFKYGLRLGRCEYDPNGIH